jgi:hypothetical protein
MRSLDGRDRDARFATDPCISPHDADYWILPGRAIVDRLGTASAIRAAALGGDAIAGPSASRHTRQ